MHHKPQYIVNWNGIHTIYMLLLVSEKVYSYTASWIRPHSYSPLPFRPPIYPSP